MVENTHHVGVEFFRSLKEMVLVIAQFIRSCQNRTVDGVVETSKYPSYILKWRLFDLTVPNVTFWLSLKIQNEEIIALNKGIVPWKSP